MKTKIQLLSIALLSLLFFSCGKDGRDGNIYITIDDTGYCMDDFSTSNPDIGYYYDVAYQTQAGTYSYTYHFCDGTGWSGTYTLYGNTGTNGGFLHDGRDGADKYFTFYILYYSGGYVERKEPINHIHNTSALVSETVNADSSFVRIYRSGNYYMKVDGHRIKK